MKGTTDVQRANSCWDEGGEEVGRSEMYFSGRIDGICSCIGSRKQ